MYIYVYIYMYIYIYMYELSSFLPTKMRIYVPAYRKISAGKQMCPRQEQRASEFLFLLSHENCKKETPTKPGFAQLMTILFLCFLQLLFNIIGRESLVSPKKWASCTHIVTPNSIKPSGHLLAGQKSCFTAGSPAAEALITWQIYHISQVCKFCFSRTTVGNSSNRIQQFAF